MTSAEHLRRLAGSSLAFATGLAVLAGCTIGTPIDATTDRGLEPGRSLTDAGAALAVDVDWSARPRYHVTADLEPATGAVLGQWSATLPVEADDDEVVLYFLPLLASVAEDAEVEDVTVDGTPVDADVSRSDATIVVPLVAGRTSVEVALTFSYQLEEVELAPPSSWDPDNPSEPESGGGLGMLARHDDGLTMGAWFPEHAYGAAGATTDRRSGNAPAAQFSVGLSVPEGYAVITSGVRTMTRTRPAAWWCSSRRSARASLRSWSAATRHGHSTGRRHVDPGPRPRAGTSDARRSHAMPRSRWPARGQRSARTHGASSTSSRCRSAVTVGGSRGPAMVWIESALMSSVDGCLRTAPLGGRARARPSVVGHAGCERLALRAGLGRGARAVRRVHRAPHGLAGRRRASLRGVDHRGLPRNARERVPRRGGRQVVVRLARAAGRPDVREGAARPARARRGVRRR